MPRVPCAADSTSAIADGSGAVHVLSPIRAADQANLPFRDIDTEPRALAEGLIGRSAGPYAGASYYGTPLDRSQYQGGLSGRPGFDYGTMADQMGAEPGSPEQSRAMAQLVARQRARQAQASVAPAAAPGGLTYDQLTLLGY
jgi:hypothetical protein